MGPIYPAELVLNYSKDVRMEILGPNFANPSGGYPPEMNDECKIGYFDKDVTKIEYNV